MPAPRETPVKLPRGTASIVAPEHEQTGDSVRRFKVALSVRHTELYVRQKFCDRTSVCSESIDRQERLSRSVPSWRWRRHVSIPVQPSDHQANFSGDGCRRKLDDNR